MKATIRDVAKYAGVSVATVSRYLNHSPLIAPQSIEKVQAAIEALNYQPSMMARGLLHGYSCTIAPAGANQMWIHFSGSPCSRKKYFSPANVNFVRLQASMQTQRSGLHGTRRSRVSE